MQQDESIGQAQAALAAHGLSGPFDCAIVLGTGLGGLVEAVEQPIFLPFSEIPGFPAGAVSGHARRLCGGRLHGRRVLILQGRAHYYETGDAAAMRLPLALLARLGAPPLILTNAAGSLRADLRPGALALIGDHINLTGRNPLIGETGDERFVPMVDAYDPALRAALRQAATTAGVALGEGVYMWFSGPSFETPAEVRMAEFLGADLVGMSTVPEVILARRFGLRVAAISVVTNMGAGLMGGAPAHEDTRDVAATASHSLQRLIGAFLDQMR